MWMLQTLARGACDGAESSRAAAGAVTATGGAVTTTTAAAGRGEGNIASGALDRSRGREEGPAGALLCNAKRFRTTAAANAFAAAWRDCSRSLQPVSANISSSTVIVRFMSTKTRQRASGLPGAACLRRVHSGREGRRASERAKEG